MPGFKEKPDVYIEPEKSVIVKIKASEINPTDKYDCFKLRVLTCEIRSWKHPPLSALPRD